MKPLPVKFDEATGSSEAVLDILIDRYDLKNDAGIARFLEISPVIVSRLRNRRVALGARMVLRIHEVTGMAISEIYSISGDRRRPRPSL